MTNSIKKTSVSRQLTEPTAEQEIRASEQKTLQMSLRFRRPDNPPFRTPPNTRVRSDHESFISTCSQADVSGDMKVFRRPG
ncbi:unnamed protein product [Clavelina lepadiformis]|uniref:Uncharacterized protein n=1 Tax=Clavelina lepadiformis TaxID=159417 RepID=A0ABP0F097_CLALP